MLDQLEFNKFPGHRRCKPGEPLTPCPWEPQGERRGFYEVTLERHNWHHPSVFIGEFNGRVWTHDHRAESIILH